MKLDLNDISIVPSILSDVSSRSEIQLEYLPLIVAPMDTIIDENNYKLFKDIGMEVCIPRNCKIDLKEDVFLSYGLDEIISLIDSKQELPKKVLIDIANGHMKKLYDISKRIKQEYPHVILMIGNIANPKTFRLYAEINVDFIRLSIGSGSVCLTAANTGIYYPLASLIIECKIIKDELKSKTNIVPDGGFNNYGDIIKGIALGADWVMLGGILSKTLESCSKKYTKDVFELTKVRAQENFNQGKEVYSYFRGMSTKEVQKNGVKKK